MRSADAEVDGSGAGRATARREEDAPPGVHAQKTREAPEQLSSRDPSRSSAFDRLGQTGRREVVRRRERSLSYDTSQRNTHHDSTSHAMRKPHHRAKAAPGVDPNDRWQSDQ